jgi:hypothetical protein
MFTVEEVRRIPWIRFTRLEARERTKWYTRPLPTISDKLADTEGAGAIRSGVNGLWIPPLKVEITSYVRGCRIAPWILAVLESGVTIRGTVKLLLGRQALT